LHQWGWQPLVQHQYMQTSHSTVPRGAVRSNVLLARTSVKRSHQVKADVKATNLIRE
jgi:hypothetical protein